ncbi:LuxR C-terminal-related transcriptional regulator [Streptomyces sp. A5-4]|uniref:LuxR C-terminal-related transcriptional regulator n=1 Tax=Streptomyces sp. A5-4 TaxID=3384771 RepID=UPI003DA8A8FE
MTIHLTVAHTEGLMRTGIVRILREADDMEVVAQVATRSQLAHSNAMQHSDIVVMDGSCRELCNPQTIREITSTTTDVLLLTSDSPDGMILRALEAGAVGFLPVNSSASELYRAIRLIAEGNGFIDPTIIRPLTRAINRTTTEEAVASDARLMSLLTPREHQVLVFLARGLPNASIAQQLKVSENTVKTHVSRLLAKLGLRSRVEAALAIRDSETSLPRLTTAASRGSGPTIRDSKSPLQGCTPRGSGQ